MVSRFYIPGELYFRKKFFPVDESVAIRLQNEFEDLLEKYSRDELGIVELYELIHTDYERLNIFKGLDYSESDTIFQLGVGSDGFYLRDVSHPERKGKLPIDEEMLDESFVSVSEFLSKARFVGERGYTENTLFFDRYMLDIWNQCMVLYDGEEGILVDFDGELIFLDVRYREADWVYDGKPIADSSEKVYKRLVLQIKRHHEEFRKD